MLFHDAQSDPRLSQHQSIQTHRIKSVIGVPILHGELVRGAIVVDSIEDRREFSEDNLALLDFFSNLISLAFDRLIRMERLEAENRLLKDSIASGRQVPKMIGTSQPMQTLADLIHKVAPTDATVLLLGESGTGKDLAAQAIHALSPRKDKPFLAQFCGAIPDTLLESELFGYKKGAFTGATADKKGLFEAADGGTFFMDEIADISLSLQAKLLRILETRELIRLGDTVPRKIDVRIIAATNRDIPKLVKSGSFREDLYYRLNIFPITLPPLRERRGDVKALALHIIAQQSPTSEFHVESLRKLEQFSWPGNVRQLVNVLHRAIIMAEKGPILPEHILFDNGTSLSDFGGTLESFEMLLLQKRLEEFHGNRTLTAQSLGVSVRWIQLKLKELAER